MGVVITATARTPPHVPVLGSDQLSPRSTTLFLEDSFKIILPSSPRYSKQFLFFRFSQRNTILIPPFPCIASLQTILYTKHTQFSIFLYSVAQLSLLEGAYMVLERKPEGKRLLGRSRYR